MLRSMVRRGRIPEESIRDNIHVGRGFDDDVGQMLPTVSQMKREWYIYINDIYTNSCEESFRGASRPGV